MISSYFQLTDSKNKEQIEHKKINSKKKSKKKQNKQPPPPKKNPKKTTCPFKNRQTKQNIKFFGSCLGTHEVVNFLQHPICNMSISNT